MSPSSKDRHGASPSSSPYRRRRDEEDSFGGEISEEEDDTFTVSPTEATIEQHRKRRAEGTRPESQNKQEGKKKEEHVTNQGRKEEEHVIQVEPDAPQMQEVAAQSSFNQSGATADSESEIMSYAFLIILLVPAVFFGLFFFGVI